MAAANRTALRPVITASKWETAYWSSWKAVSSAHGVTHGSDGTEAPRISNAEAVQLISAWRSAAGVNFPLWYQYAAVAFDWSPTSGLDQSMARAAQAYPDDVDASLWPELYRLALQLDNERAAGERHGDPRLDLSTSFLDPVFAGKVAAQLTDDNGGVTPAFKIPSGLCIDKRTGKRRLMRARCRKGAVRASDGQWYHADPITGVKTLCDQPGDCVPELVDDPVTYAGKQLFTLALIVGAVWWFARKNPRRRRRN